MSFGTRSYREEIEHNSTLGVVMLGPRRTGKSTLLAVMSERLDSMSSVAIHFKSKDGKTDAKIKELWEDLKRIRRQPGGGYQPDILGDDIEHLYEYQVVRREQSNGLLLRFRDYPGGWLSMDEPNHHKVKKFVSESQVAIVAIDTAYLIEEGGRHHESRNMPDACARVLHSASHAPELIVLCPTRCERYTGTNADRESLLERVLQGYGGIVRTCNDRQIPLAVTPVETTGCLEWSGFRQQDPKQQDPKEADYPSSVFYLKSQNAKYSPRDSDQPLRYILSLTIQRYLNARASGMWGWLNSLFNRDRDFHDAVNEFSGGIKKTGGFYFSGWK